MSNKSLGSAIFDAFGELFGRAIGLFSSYFRERVFNRIFEEIESEYGDALASTLDEIRQMPNIPPAMREIADKLSKRQHPVWWMAALAFIAAFGFQFAGGIINPFVKIASYKGERVAHSARFDPDLAYAAARRLKDESFLEDLKELGYSDKHIEALKELTKFWPSPSDIITWLAKEVFEPSAISRFGLDEGLSEVMGHKELFDQIGIDEDMIRNFWIAHWIHPSFDEMAEMRRRDYITDDDLWMWYTLVEIPPYWRDFMNKIVWVTPTRVDIRRFWDMGTIDEARLRQYYTMLGYKDQNLEDYVLWTKVNSAAPDLVARYKNGWITEEEVINELVSLGMKPDMAKNLVETKIKKSAPERTTKERDLTKSEIIKGVKLGQISADEGKSMLTAMGYDDKEADYIIAINVAPAQQVESKVKEKNLTKSDILSGLGKGIIGPETAINWLTQIGYSEEEATYLVMTKLGISTVGSPPVSPEGANPRNKWEIEAKVQELRKAQGLPYKLVPAELIEAEHKYEKKKLEIEQAKAKGVSEDDLAPLYSELALLENEYFKQIKAYQQLT